MTTDTVAEATRNLGVRLAALREAAGHTQASLARLVGYSRSTVANAEAGQGAARHFWEMCDEVLGGAGLLELFDEIRALHRRHRQEAAEAVRRRREAEVQQWRQEARERERSGHGSVEAWPSASLGVCGPRRSSSGALCGLSFEAYMVGRFP